MDSRCVIARTSIAYFTRTVLAFRKKLTSSRQGPSIRVSPVRLAMTVPTPPRGLPFAAQLSASIVGVEAAAAVASDDRAPAGTAPVR